MLPSIPFAPFDVSEVYRRLNKRHSLGKSPRLASLNDHLIRDIGMDSEQLRNEMRRAIR